MHNIKKSFSLYFVSSLLAAGILIIGATMVLATPADTGVKYPGTITTNSEAPYDDENWTSPGNVDGDDGGNASITTNNFDDTEYSHVLRATNFDFSAMPIDGTIQGIKVEIERKSDSNQRGKDAVVQLTKDGAARVGDNKADTSNEWPTSFAVKTYGGSTDLWGTTWTPAEIKASSFGVHLAAQATDNDADIYVDFIRITIYYDAPERTITASTGTGGVITPSGAVTVNDGDDKIFTIQPNTGYIVSDVLVDSSPQGRINSYTFNNVTADHVISAGFDSAWSAPGGSVDTDSDVGTPNEAFTSNNLYAVLNSSNDEVDYTNFGLDVPSAATVNGIEVALEGNRASNRTTDILLSWNGGANFTSGKSSGDFSSTDSTLIVGGSSNTWGRTWSPNDFINANFRIRVDHRSGSGDWSLDQIQVKVYYTVPPGHIVVDKITDPADDPQSFSFYVAGGAYADFALTDADTPNDQTLVPDSYSVSETVPSGWVQSNAVCVSSIGDSETVGAIELDSGETVTCTFTNTKQATLTINKSVVPATDIGKFNLQIDGDTAGTGADVDDGGTTGPVFVAPGVEHTVGETAGTGTNLADYASVVGGDCGPDGQITLSSGDNKTCTIANTKFGSITIIKNAIPDDPQNFSFTATGNGLSDFTLDDDSDGALSNTKIFSHLAAGSYSVAETALPDNWDKTEATCDDFDTGATEIIDPASITLEVGQNLVCIFTNTKRAAFYLEKISDPNSGDEPLSFQFELDGPDSYYNSTTFSPSGTWDITNILSGAYSLLETVLSPADWTGSQAIACNGNGDNDPSGSVVNSFALTFNPGEAMSCTVNNTQDALITGKKFEDTDADGIAGEDSGLSDWSITATQIIVDNPDTPEVDESQNASTRTETTDGDGDYTLRVPPGTYHVCEQSQPEDSDMDWHQSYPTGSTVGSTSCEDGYIGYELVVTAGGNKNGVDFGNYRNGSISGYKWEDANADGEFDADGESEEGNENLLDEWTIFLDLNDNGILDDGEPSQETGDEEEGFYSFENLVPGTYIVREVNQSGWTQTYPIPNKHEVSLASGESVTDVNFGNFELVDIAGFKWDDTNGDGIWQKENETTSGEPGLQDVTVALGSQSGKPREENGHEIIPIEIVAMSLTGADGGFVIRDVGPGHYKLFEESKSGWQTTNPTAHTDSFFDITYRIDLQPQQKPLVQDSFFDVFAEISGRDVRQSEATKNLITTFPSVPLEFGNHQLLVINKEMVTATKVEQTSATITWTTDRPGTSRVVYDIVSHPVLGSAPNYGYAFSTDTFDADPNKVTSHLVTISGFTSGTTYYYRTVSSASPESVSDEGSVTTSSPSPSSSESGGGGGGGGGGGLPPEAYNPPVPPEGGFSVLINNGAGETNSRNITLALGGGPNTAKMTISNLPDFSQGAAMTGQINYQPFYNWDTCQGLDSCTDGIYTVYAKFYTQWGYSSHAVSDDIAYRTARAAASPATISGQDVSLQAPVGESIVSPGAAVAGVSGAEEQAAEGTGPSFEQTLVEPVEQLSPVPSETPQPPYSLLAAVVTVGTGNWGIGLAVLAVAFGIFYVAYRYRRGIGRVFFKK